MKKLVIFALLCFAAVWTATEISGHKDPMTPLLLYNIEALAADEHADAGFCYGTGTVNCPAGNVKVEWVFGGYSLEE